MIQPLSGRRGREGGEGANQIVEGGLTHKILEPAKTPILSAALPHGPHISLLFLFNFIKGKSGCDGSLRKPQRRVRPKDWIPVFVGGSPEDPHWIPIHIRADPPSMHALEYIICLQFLLIQSSSPWFADPLRIPIGSPTRLRPLGCFSQPPADIGPLPPAPPPLPMISN